MLDIKKNHVIAEIDRAAIEHNCRLLRSLTPPGCRQCVAVKANAYGHGVEIVVPAVEAADADMLAVATIDEARQLRDLRWPKPVLLMGSNLSIYGYDQKRDVAGWLVEHGIRVTVVDRDDMQALAESAKRMNKQVYVHLKFDSGMSRMGVDEETLLELIDAYKAHPSVVIEGLYTHFATADEGDKDFAEAQLGRFIRLVDRVRESGVQIPLIHASNSAASIDLPSSHFNMVRPGISVYGYHTSDQMHNKPDLRPVMRVISYLTLVKKVTAGSYLGYGRTYQAKDDMPVGLVPVGYADGYDRRLSNIGQMSVAGHSVEVVGRVSMDQTIIDLRALVDAGVSVSPGDEVVVIDNKRDAPNSVESIAKQLGTIAYEVTTKLGERILRVPV